MITVDSRSLYKRNAHASRHGTRLCGWCLTVGATAVTAALTACSSFGGLTGDSTPAPAPASTASTATATSAPTSSNASFTSRVKSLFSGNSGTLNAATPQSAAAAPDIDCPGVEYRQGAATMAINSPGSDNALDLRYQLSFTQTARECVLRGNELTIKVGVQGRIVVGPAGGPGPVSIPLR